MNLSRRITTLARNPAMVRAYGQWIASRFAFGRSPRLRLSTNVEVVEWLSFSEYWAFSEGIPRAERLYADSSLAPGSDGGKVAVDIGANVGLFSCYLASISASLHAFEPIASTFCRLEKNMKHNSLLERATLNCLAVGEDLRIVPFSVNDLASATNRLSAGSPTERRQWVASVSLDEYSSLLGLSVIHFLKIDVEGMEPYVLKGARSLLLRKAVKHILIEICPVNLRSVGLSVSALAEEIRAIPYTPFALDADGRPAHILTEDDLGAIELSNVALLPNA